MGILKKKMQSQYDLTKNSFLLFNTADYEAVVISLVF